VAGIGFTQVDLGDGVYAGFTNRYGGVSEAPYDSLNLGPNVGDAVAAVAENRALMAALVGAPVVFSSQIHGKNIIEIDDVTAAPWLSETPPITAGEADALFTAADLGLGVLVADCVPVILAATKGDGVGATMVATAHAGRRGVELNVVGAVIDLMKAYGATQIKAAIGPSICGRCYEVPEKMRAEVAAIEPKTWAQTRQGTPSLDLPAAVADQLTRAGAEVVFQSQDCTLEHPNYFSHRRATQFEPGGKTGRQAGIVKLARTPIG